MYKKTMLAVLTTWLALTAIFLILVACGSQPQTSQITPTASTARVGDNGVLTKLLVFSKTGAFRHASIPDGIAALHRLAVEHQVTIDFTEDSTAFTDVNLSHYKAVIFLLTTGNILNDDQKGAFERYIRAGGGYVGVHSASDTEHQWLWYGNLVGAYFRSHPSVTQATINVVDSTHPSTSMLPKQWVRTDEWYNFVTNPHGTVHVLLNLDETTYKGGTMGVNHPIAWYHTYDGGRAWYTALGHTSASYSEPLFLAHLWGGIVYAAGLSGQ
ncbi:MAG TPA: ThuA domain-containing protein [Ktedonosporobacter sp.]|nr:ThuA domain-containing protein [Ktedonosporobacter sp.]